MVCLLKHLICTRQGCQLFRERGSIVNMPVLIVLINIFITGFRFCKKNLNTAKLIKSKSNGLLSKKRLINDHI